MHPISLPLCIEKEKLTSALQTHTQPPTTSKSKQSSEDVDWSKISTDTRTTTNIGSDEDPGRAAEQKLVGRTLAAGGSSGGSGKTTAEKGGFEQLSNEEKLD